MPFEDRASYAPFVLRSDEDDREQWLLTLTEAQMEPHSALFEARGQSLDGPTWSALALQAVRKHAPKLEGHVRFVPEDDVFVARGSMKAMQGLGTLLRGLFYEPERVGRLLADLPS